MRPLGRESESQMDSLRRVSTAAARIHTRAVRVKTPLCRNWPFLNIQRPIPVALIPVPPILAVSRILPFPSHLDSRLCLHLSPACRKNYNRR